MARQEEKTEEGPVLVEVDVHRADEPQEQEQQQSQSSAQPSAPAPTATPVEGRLLKIIVVCCDLVSNT